MEGKYLQILKEEHTVIQGIPHASKIIQKKCFRVTVRTILCRSLKPIIIIQAFMGEKRCFCARITLKIEEYFFKHSE